ncbi:carboxypeptidase regulatory-like domain-containing protein [Flavobacteriaceae bacterium GSB9]|nr:carboxypeptidase regulatory-like domain-containing protein [Flavobacteriaceae bacterium GSB9]
MIKKHYKFLLFILLGITIFTCEKNEPESFGNIQGIITSNGLKVSGASIILGAIDQTTSDSKGQYSFEEIKANTYQIKISKGGYAPTIEKITILGEQNQVKNFEIIKISDPVIFTGTITDITQTSATLNANINFLGTGYPGTIEHGHCWSKTPNPTVNNSKTELGTPNSIGEYQSKITGLEAKTQYYVRAYIKIGSIIFYGNEIEFKAKAYPPEIIDFNPKFGPIRTIVEISGNQFSEIISENIVKFGDFTAEIESATENLLVVKVPYVDNAQKVNISVTIEDNTNTSQDLFDIWFPWAQKNSQSSKTFNAASFVSNGYGYVIGSNSKFMLKYNPVYDSWENNLSLPEDSGKKPFAFTSESKVFILLANGFWEYNTETNNWTQRTNFPGRLQTDRRYNFNFSIDGKFYIGNCYNTYDFWEYNIIQDSWNKKADFIGNFDTSNPVWGNYTFSLDKKGFLGVSQTAFGINTLWEYNPTQDSWITKTPIPSNAYNLYASFIINNEAYVGLGRNFEWGDGYVSNKLWKYNISNDTWIELQNSPINMAVYTSFGINKKGYILPAYTKFNNILNDVWEFDPYRN